MPLVWNVIEPKPGEFRWEIIDLALREARRHGQRLAIRIMPYDQTHPLPQWYQQSGVRRANDNSTTDQSIWEPDFADPLYYRYWGRLVIEAGKRYDGHPDLDSVDISTVGYWGEGWSNYMPEFEVQRKLIDVYFTAFRKTPLLMNFDQPEALSTAHPEGRDGVSIALVTCRRAGRTCWIFIRSRSRGLELRMFGGPRLSLSKFAGYPKNGSRTGGMCTTS